MEISEAKKKVDESEELLKTEIIAEIDRREVNDRTLVTFISNDLMKKCKKGKLWKSQQFYITLKNIKYGLEQNQMRSVSGRDGIFLVDRDYKPKNSMQTKIYDRFIDNESSAFESIVERLSLDKRMIKGVRVVSHHLRLLGILDRKINEDVIVLVDFDNEK